MSRVVIPGGTGYLGRALTEQLVARGDDVVLLTRGPAQQAEGWRAVTWDAHTVGDWAECLDGAGQWRTNRFGPRIQVVGQFELTHDQNPT